MTDYDNAFIERQKKRSEEFNSLSKQTSKDAFFLEKKINYMLNNFGKENNCHLIVEVIDGEFKILELTKYIL